MVELITRINESLKSEKAINYIVDNAKIKEVAEKKQEKATKTSVKKTTAKEKTEKAEKEPAKKTTTKKSTKKAE